MELRDVKTKIIGKNVKYFKEISSTHIYAKELVINMLDKEKNKSVVVILMESPFLFLGKSMEFI